MTILHRFSHYGYPGYSKLGDEQGPEDMQTSFPVEGFTTMLDIFVEDTAEGYVGFVTLGAEAACAVLHAHFRTCCPVVRRNGGWGYQQWARNVVAEEAIKQFGGGRFYSQM